MTVAYIAIGLWILTILGYIIWNLYQKNSKMERIIIFQQNYINGIRSIGSEVDQLVNKIDTTMWVQSDPELLQLFESIKNLKNLLIQYKSEDAL